MNTVTHELKIWPNYFNAVISGRKTFEVRKNDRDFKEGDFLLLREWGPLSKIFTGRDCKVQVLYILQGGQWGIEEGYCILGIKLIEEIEN